MPANTKNRGQRGGRGPGQGGPSGQQAVQQPAAYDGPPESSGGAGRGRGGSTSGGSVARASSQTRRDAARDAPDPGAAPVLVKNVDFGGQAYDLYSSVRESCQ